ncbi:MAG: hypothetical protein AAF267_19160 [Deinococcota bacterium]
MSTRPLPKIQLSAHAASNAHVGVFLWGCALPYSTLLALFEGG